MPWFGRFLFLAFAVCAFAAPGGNPPPAPIAPAGRSFVDWSPASRLPRWLRIGVQVRGRFEAPSGASAASSASDAYYLSRLRVDIAFHPAGWLQLFAQAQDARVAAYNGSPSAAVYNPVDLRQAYIAIEREGRVNLALRAGRQELAFGSERVIGAADWGMSRSFDAAAVSFSRNRDRVDLFAGSPVLVDGSRFDRHKPGEHLYGVYASFREVLPGVAVEPYLLFKQNLLVKSEGGLGGDALVASPGIRIAGRAPGRLDYAVEALLQRGSWSADRIAASAQSLVVGWTVSPSPLQPRISGEYNRASGDSAAKDGARGTFDQFYPSNHLYYGMIDQFAWKNLENWRAGFDCAPVRKLKLRTDFNQFYLATVQDALYNSAGASAILNRGATSRHIGAEWNAVALYQWSRIWKFGGGYGRLFAGGFLKQSGAAFGYSYPYLMFVGSF